MLRKRVLASAALAAVLIGSAGAASSAPTDAHLYVVPDTAGGTSAIAEADAEVVARYDAFALVAADDSASPALAAAGADRRDDMSTVAVAGGTIDPALAPPLEPDGGRELAIVQFVGPVKDGWYRALRRTGGEVISYIAQNAYIVYAPPASAAAVAGLAAEDFVTGVTPFTAAAKTEGGLPASGPVSVSVQTVAGRAGEAVRARLSEGRRLQGRSRYAAVVTDHVTVDAGLVAELAGDPAVIAVEPWVEPELLDERAAQIVAGNLNPAGTVPTGPGYLSHLAAEGFPTARMPFVVDVTDSGVDKGIVPAPAGSHPDFHLSGNPAQVSRIEYAQEASADANARDCGGHGTNVASIATGFNNATGAANEDAAGFNYGLGIAPRARLGTTKVFACAGGFDVQTSITALRDTAYADGARISNNSWGAPVGGAYTAMSQEFDALVRDSRPAVTGNQQMAQVVSAGNSGSGANSIGAPGTAKNVITVGASESVRAIGASDGCGVPDAGANSARDVISFSSRGPTDDGRLKPDVVAPGTHVTGAQPQTGADYNGSGTCNPQFPAGSLIYSLVSGTSQAAPEVTGFAALLRDWYTREEAAGPPSPALLKALMINTATDLAGGDNGAGGANTAVPTQTQGWGRINLANALDGTAREYVDQSSRMGTTGSRHRRVYRVASAGEPLRVTLVWTDAPGNTVGNSFVNDLDLVVHQGGNSYKGNVFAAGASVGGGAADPRNNVENVFVPAAGNGRFTVDVTATNVAGNGVPGNADPTDQDYALVVTNAEPSSGPVLAHESATVNEIGDGDGAIEPGERFSLRERLRNVGTRDATGISSVLSANEPALTVPTNSSAFPDIAAGAAGSSTNTFRVRLGAGYCGSTADLTLRVTTQGVFNIPIRVPTTAPPPAVNHNSSDVPKAIPDLSSVDSTLTVGAAGTIEDLNVRLTSLTHSFDGDLVISLIGPDDTSVLLANRRGAGGDNFSNTVFDDEAATAIASGSAPFTGSFRPEQPLSAFDGSDATGTWTLRVADQAGGDSGTLNSWGLTRRACG